MSEMDTPRITKTTRESGDLSAAFERWLRSKLGPDAAVLSFEKPDANGMSSETILLSAEWTQGGVRTDQDLVMRLAPPDDAFPVFERYDLTEQFETMRLVGELTDVPVPSLFWNEPSPEALGAPFFVMGRARGQVPPDVMPYTFGSWVSEATDAERALMERETVRVLTRLAAVEAPAATFAMLAPAPGDHRGSLRRHVDASRRWLDWSVGEEASPLLDRCFDWLEANWPADEGDTVLSWGDSRIGNIMYDGFRPAAVFDWEMAALGPRELDAAWLIFLHRFFDDIALQMELPGIPGFLRRDRVESLYRELSGHQLRHMDWYLMYAATRHGIVFTRIARRMWHFGDAERPEDLDDAIMHRATLEAMLEGTYWDDPTR